MSVLNIMDTGSSAWIPQSRDDVQSFWNTLLWFNFLDIYDNLIALLFVLPSGSWHLSREEATIVCLLFTVPPVTRA